jgi:hypothetical protein
MWRHQMAGSRSASGEKLVAGPRVSPARVRVADIRGEEFDVAPGGRLAGVRDQRRHQMGAVGQGRERAGLDGRGKLVGGCHAPFPTTNLTHDKDVIMREIHPETGQGSGKEAGQ